MGNRAYLYLCTAEEAENGRGRSFAEANNVLPTLWRVLLAGGAAGTPIAHQRVFGDAGTANLVAPAAPAKDRIAAIRDFVERHPRLPLNPALPGQLRALEAYLRQECAAVADGDDAAALHFSADLDELAWLDPEPRAFVERCRADCDALWQRLQDAMRHGDADGFDAALELHADGNRGFGDWSAWAWTFGLGGLDHPYFDADEPREVAFEAFDPHADERLELEHGLEVFRERGRCGLRRWAAGSDEPVVVAAAEWDGIEPAGDAPGLLRVQRGGRVGLMRVAAANGPSLVRAPEFEWIDDFVDAGGAPLAVAAHPDGIGLLQADGAWRIAPGATEPPLDALLPAQHERLPACAGGRWGLLDPWGRWVLAPRYERIDAFAPSGLAPVAAGGRVGLVDRDGREVLPPRYDALGWDEEREVFEIELDGRRGWLRADGRVWIAPAWERLQPLDGHGVLVRRDGRWGLLDGDGRERIAPRYRTLEPLADAAAAPPLLLARDRALGVVDVDGRVVVPFEYAGIAPFAAARCGDADAGAHLLLLARRRRGEPPRYGAWDLRRRAEALPCEYDLLQAFAYRDAGGAAAVAYIAGRCIDGYGDDREGALRIGVLREDGSELHPLDFVRLSIDDLADTETPEDLAALLGEAWSRGGHLDARDPYGGRWRLWRDGQAMSEPEWWEQRFHERGDREAALRLAEHFADGGEPEPARYWMGLAAGLASPPRESGRGLLRRLLRPARDWMPREVAADGVPEAMLRLARMLRDGEGGRAEPAAARAWLEHLLAHRDRNHRQAHVELGDLYDEGVGGAVDLGRALELFRRAAVMNHPDAHWRVAYAYEEGRGVAVDLEQALHHYRLAARGGVPSGAHRGARVAIALAARADAAARKRLLGEAKAWLRPLAGDEDYEWRGHARLLLGEACLQRVDGARDIAEAERCFLRLAEQGDEDGIARLIALYEDPDGGRHDPAAAARWRRRSGAGG
ncbi:SEL1-like repeat protein [Vulcaniibacterium tengchongense]|uniref:TPR repeat protein n=1 Tax=Vulcaniibacterium tengchongense TaxID=1273429 RepID=A0A3N4VPQ6_9GAMM|nr:SEL1-like repeat protein [Vulcaniibacterium tengchongense]RPE75780.1 hypothetical protein EDC50_2675 [Vulcaniibacterium tengchongense]